jgi:hypothetical protein
VGKLDDALKQVNAAISLASGDDFDLQHRLLALKTHFGTLTGKGGKPDGKATPAVAARTVAQHILTSKLTGNAAKALIAEAWQKADPGTTAALQHVPCHELSLLAWAACVSGNADLSEELACIVSGSQDLRPRVWADLVRAEEKLKLLAADDSLSSASVSTRIAVLESLEQCVESFRMCPDMDGVHAACR